MNKKMILGLVCFFLLFPVFGQVEESDESLYTRGLELLVAEDISGAMGLFNRILEEYPDTRFKENILKYKETYEKQVDHSGIVPFYLGWIGTSVYGATDLVSVAGLEGGTFQGGAGLLGLGAGVGTSWLLSDGQNISLEQDLWIEFSELASLVNYTLVMNVIQSYTSFESIDLYAKIRRLGFVGVSIASRLGGYYMFRENLPSPGTVGTMINSYGWSSYYLATILGMLNVDLTEQQNLVTALYIAVPDLAAFGGYLLQDQLNWSLGRNGMIAIGGLGGAIFGGCINLIVTGGNVFGSSQLASGIMMASTLAGHGLGIYLTRNMDKNKQIAALDSNIMLMPAATPEGFGLTGRIVL